MNGTFELGIFQGGIQEMSLDLEFMSGDKNVLVNKVKTTLQV